MICTNPLCVHAGDDQPEENFYHWCRVCKDCKKAAAKDQYWRNRKKRLEGARIIPDNDPETDLVKVELGEGAWAKITR